MSYAPLPIKQGARVSRFATAMPLKGRNTREFSALLDPQSALSIVNYIPMANGIMMKRKGIEKITEVAGGFPSRILGRFTDDILIFSYNTTVAAYNESTDTITNIKTNFTANDGFNGLKYGEYFFVCNGVDKIWRIDSALAIAEIAASPICKGLAVLGARLIAFNLSTDETAVQYSEIDSGTNPPFTTWSDGTLGTDGGIVNYRNAGAVNDVNFLGDIIVVLAQFGKWAFTIEQIESGGTIKKIDQTIMDRIDVGGKASVMTDKGMFYVNKTGVWLLVSLGQPNIPFSDQEFGISFQLGPEYFGDINFDNASLSYDEVNELLFIACAKGGTTNNFVICYNAQTKGYSEFDGLNIERFFSDNNGDILASSSIQIKLFKCFKGYDDDGAEIGTEYYQELNVGDFNTDKSLLKFVLQGSLSDDTVLNITFDIFDYFGVLKTFDQAYCMQIASPLGGTEAGYGEISYGSGYGSAGQPSDFIDGISPVYGSYKPGIRSFQRIRVRVTSSDTLPHTLNLFNAEIKEKAFLRNVKNISLC